MVSVLDLQLPSFVVEELEVSPLLHAADNSLNFRREAIVAAGRAEPPEARVTRLD